jgi:hypothetical protein
MILQLVLNLIIYYYMYEWDLLSNDRKLIIDRYLNIAILEYIITRINLYLTESVWNTSELVFKTAHKAFGSWCWVSIRFDIWMSELQAERVVYDEELRTSLS